MNQLALYPLKFEPIYQYRLWGGRRLTDILTKPLPKDEPVGEAWLLSDRDDQPSEVADGPLKGYSIAKLMKEAEPELMGKFSGQFKRFPLLLKFLDCKEVLSVQVHPNDHQKQYIPQGDSGKTEAWVVLETAPDARIYAGLTPGTTKENLREAIENHQVANKLHSFIPKVGDGVFIKAGTVHTLGGAVVFEVQENSDTTFRLYDWDRTDAKTGKPRDLQVKEALAVIDFDQVDIGPVNTEVIEENGLSRNQLFNNDHFVLWRVKSESPFQVGMPDTPWVLVCIEGKGNVVFNGNEYPLHKGDVMLLPATLGPCEYIPEGKVILLEIGIPNNK